MTRCCYMIVLAELTDRERFLAGYASVVPALVTRFGGHYLIRGAGGTFLEGGGCEHPSALISQWPSREHALRFWNSPEYQQAKKLREGTGRFQVMLIGAPAISPTGSLPREAP
ncbi:MAG: DUF1330 domain-containing protein [Gammaproteobacteria bacterium]|nr:DUF1330 domain-containing protein [Gammaproteobacteria bacterium]